MYEVTAATGGVDLGVVDPDPNPTLEKKTPDPEFGDLAPSQLEHEKGDGSGSTIPAANHIS